MAQAIKFDNRELKLGGILRYMVPSVIFLILAFVFSPGGKEPLIQITPSGIRDQAQWAKVDNQFKFDSSSDGKNLKADDTTFRFNGEKYFIPLSPDIKVPEVYSISFRVKIKDENGLSMLAAIESDNANPLLVLYSQSVYGKTNFFFGNADHFGNWRMLRSGAKPLFNTGEWIHVTYVVNYKLGIEKAYLNGSKNVSSSMSAGSSPGLIPKRLWIGSSPDPSPTNQYEIRDIQLINGELTWWQIQMYLLFNKYFYSVFHIPLTVLFIFFFVCSIILFTLFSFVLVKKSNELPSPSRTPIPSEDDSDPFRIIHKSIFMIFALTGFFFILFAFYPGAMSLDSVGQYQQGHDWQFSDGFPPLMAAVLGIIDRIFHSPAPLMILHNSFYWFSFFLIAVTFLRVNIFIAYLFSVLGYWPAFITWTGVLWKDTGTGTSFLLASAILFYYATNGLCPKLYTAIIVTLLLLFGALVRTYSFLSYIPLAFWLAYLLYNQSTAKYRLVKLGSVFLGITVLFPILSSTTEAVLHTRHDHFIQFILDWDLLGITINSGEKCLLHKYHKPDFPCSELKRLYTPVCHDTVSADSRSPLIRVNDLKPLFHDWLSAVLMHPKAYLTHRWNIFTILFSFDDRPSWNYFRAIEANSFGFALKPSWSGGLFDSYVQNASSWIFFGYIYLLFSFYEVIYLAVVMYVRKSIFKMKPFEVSILFLCLSSLLYFLPYYFIVPSRDFRYLYWGTLASTIALILMLYSLFSTAWAVRNVNVSQKTKADKHKESAGKRV